MQAVVHDSDHIVDVLYLWVFGHCFKEELEQFFVYDCIQIFLLKDLVVAEHRKETDALSDSLIVVCAEQARNYANYLCF